MDNFYKKIDEIARKDLRYKSDAYEFLMRALWFTQNRLKRHGHVSGKELLMGIKDFALEQYGPMAKTVLNHWGIKVTDDFGAMVFNMVECGLLHKTKEDSLKDFKNVYDFNEAFEVFKNHAYERLNNRITGRKPAEKSPGKNLN